jgi:ribosome-binding protein aMBF1 (putative translation factor)
VIFPVRKMMTTIARQFGAEVSRAHKVLGMIRRELVPAINIDAQIVGDLERGKPTAQHGKAVSGSPS